MTEIDQLKAFQDHARTDPIGWIERWAFGIQDKATDEYRRNHGLWRKQEDAEAYDQVDMYRMANEWEQDDVWEQCHGTGKSSGFSLIAIQMMVAYAPDFKAMLLPPNLESADDIFFPELDKWWSVINNNTGGKLEDWFGRPLKTQWVHRYDEGCFIKAYNPRHPENIHGRKCKYLLLMLDEATAAELRILRALRGLRSGGSYVKVIYGCNPLTTECEFYRNIVKKDSVRRIRIPADNHPNVYLNLNPDDEGYRHGMISVNYINRLKADCETEIDDYTKHPDWLARVKAIWPTGDNEFTLVTDDMFDAACERTLSPGSKYFGLDLSRGGDKTVLTIMDGGTIAHIQAWSGAYISQTALGGKRKPGGVTTKELASVLKSWGCTEGGCDTTFNPAIAEDLQREGIIVRPINFGSTDVRMRRNEQGQLVKEFDYKSSEILWQVREAFESGELAISSNIPTRIKELLRSDLKRQYKFTKGGIGVKNVEPKDVFKKRTGRSPDYGDSLGTAVAKSKLKKPSGEFMFV